MGQFRKKPVVIEAVQFTKANFEEIEKFVGGDAEFRDGELIVATLEGPLRAADHDWIIKGVKGEFYPCKPDIFAATYGPADTPAAAQMMTDEEVAATNFNPHPHLRALEVHLDQLTSERDHLKAAVEHQRADLARLRAKPADTTPPETLLLGLTRMEAENLQAKLMDKKADPDVLANILRAVEALLA